MSGLAPGTEERRAGPLGDGAPPSLPAAPPAWYEEWFERDEYELVYRPRDDRDAERLVALLLDLVRPEPGARILDMGCGRGRHALRLATRGYRVTGIDLSRRAVEQARQRSTRARHAVTFRQGDMREVQGVASYDGVVNLFTAFGYFAEERDHLRVVRAMAAALRPDGWLVQDFLNAPYVETHLVPESATEVDGVRIEQRRWIAGGRVEKEIRIHRGDGWQTFFESVRLLTREDFEALYDAAGLELVGALGDYDGSPYTAESPRLILHARKR